MTTTTKGSSGLAQRYAAALFELAEGDKALDTVADELRRLASMIEGSEDLRRLIRSPVISRDDQQRGMTAVLQAVGIGPLVQKFVGLVASNRRLFALPAMMGAYQEMMADRRGETVAEVVAAQTLSPEQLGAVEAILKKAVGTEVALSTRVDPQLLGGLVVKVGSRMIDFSLSTKLKRLSLAMKGIG
ncbi:MAG TPA: F0F1 ATP synthase subunit delta [Rhodospirillales bacterium]|nr:F0F1 ATP synthase subunit delta [Rhodospirillales bacterium]